MKSFLFRSKLQINNKNPVLLIKSTKISALELIAAVMTNTVLNKVIKNHSCINHLIPVNLALTLTYALLTCKF